MSWLLTDREFAEAVEAAGQGEVTRPLYAFIGRLVHATAMSRTIAPALSPTGKWENRDDVDEAVQEWFADTLPMTLRRAFDVTTTPSGFSRYLETALRNWLISRARSSGQPRLLARAREIMAANPNEFAKVVTSEVAADELWGLAGWREREPFAGDDRRLATAAFAVGDLEIVRYSAGSTNADPILSTEDLRRLLLALLENLGQPLRIRDIDRALRARFGFAYPAEEISLDEALDQPAEQDLAPLNELELNDALREALAELTGRQLAIVRDRITQQLPYDELSARHGVSRGTVQNELTRAQNVVRAHTPAGSQPSELLEKVVDFAFKRVDPTDD